MRPILLLLPLALLGCATRANPPADDLTEAERVLEDYRQAWIAGDSARVLSRVSEGFVMVTPGKTVAGKEQVRPYWFPSSDTAYPIRTYDVSDQKVYGQGDFAIAEGNSFLAWDTTVRDSVIASATSKTEFINVLRRESGSWKLYRAIFVMR